MVLDIGGHTRLKYCVKYLSPSCCSGWWVGWGVVTPPGDSGNPLLQIQQKEKSITTTSGRLRLAGQRDVLLCCYAIRSPWQAYIPSCIVLIDVATIGAPSRSKGERTSKGSSQVIVSANVDGRAGRWVGVRACVFVCVRVSLRVRVHQCVCMCGVCVCAGEMLMGKGVIKRVMLAHVSTHLPVVALCVGPQGHCSTACRRWWTCSFPARWCVCIPSAYAGGCVGRWYVRIAAGGWVVLAQAQMFSLPNALRCATGAAAGPGSAVGGGAPGAGSARCGGSTTALAAAAAARRWRLESAPGAVCRHPKCDLRFACAAHSAAPGFLQDCGQEEKR